MMMTVVSYRLFLISVSDSDKPERKSNLKFTGTIKNHFTRKNICHENTKSGKEGTLFYLMDGHGLISVRIQNIYFNADPGPRSAITMKLAKGPESRPGNVDTDPRKKNMQIHADRNPEELRRCQ
jgi:hypothetical protein